MTASDAPAIARFLQDHFSGPLGPDKAEAVRDEIVVNRRPSPDGLDLLDFRGRFTEYARECRAIGHTAIIDPGWTPEQIAEALIAIRRA